MAPPRFRYVETERRWYRLVREGRDALDFARTRDVGGRYNPPRSWPTLYFGDQPATCLLEVLVHAGAIPDHYQLATVEVVRDRLVDLTTDAGRRAAKVSLEQLVAPPEPAVSEQGAVLGTRYGRTWELGRLAWERGADGLLVPSAALPVQQVLVLFDRPECAPLRVASERIPIDPRMRRRG